MAKKYVVDNDVINIASLQDGQVAEVVKWGKDVSRVGALIQRFKTTIIVIGEHGDYSYPSILSADNLEDYLVKVLKEGNLIQL